ncbi:hypothetical protein [Phaffia rhodozyma]|uniref:Phospholipid/glycerol acyltransferase domain-containing protein n=1 Tax=Phaffia rhodozyma TaxID=264483 RepID=A0A0F7SQS0_PHARH|nr:hypothetical protein [Phaffia rhodozyma]
MIAFFADSSKPATTVRQATKHSQTLELPTSSATAVAMEKYSRWRDPGTGIQPFLTPIPPRSEASPLESVFTGIRYVVGVVRAIPIVLCGILYLLTVEIIGGILSATTPSVIHRPYCRVASAVWTRLILLFLGALRLDVKFSASTSRGKSDLKNTWKPKAGDLIVSNWVSWIELLWFTYKFDPIFVFPSEASSLGTPPTVFTLPLSRTLLYTGYTPSTPPTSTIRETFSDVQTRAKQQDRVLCLFPEGTTSNGRGVLKFEDVFGNHGERKGWTPFGIWLVCVKYPSPTPLTSSATYSIPSAFPILAHLLKILTDFPPFVRGLPTSFTLLAPNDSPLSSSPGLTEACAKGITTAGRLKRVGFGWEDKDAFFQAFYTKKPTGTFSPPDKKPTKGTRKAW